MQARKKSKFYEGNFDKERLLDDQTMLLGLVEQSNQKNDFFCEKVWCVGRIYELREIHSFPLDDPGIFMFKRSLFQL